MLARIRAFDADGASAVRLRLRLVALIVPAGLLLAACSEAPRPPLAGPDPADPGARTRGVDYRSTIGSYRSQRPVEPAPWAEQNERVSPAPRSGQ